MREQGRELLRKLVSAVNNADALLRSKIVGTRNDLFKALDRASAQLKQTCASDAAHALNKRIKKLRKQGQVTLPTLEELALSVMRLRLESRPLKD